MNLLDEFDKTVQKFIYEDSVKSEKRLRECYEFLSEFCHPNFHSNLLAIDLDKSSSLFKLRYETDPRPAEFHVINYLLICIPVFIALFDDAQEILNNLSLSPPQGA